VTLTHFGSVIRNFKYIGDGMEMMEIKRDFFLREIGKVEVWEWGIAALEGWGGRMPLIQC